MASNRLPSEVKGGYWLEDSGLQAEDINSTLFTHLFCAFANLDNTGTDILTISPTCSTFPEIVRKRNPSVKVLLSIGGGNIGSKKFDTMASMPKLRGDFIESSISLATTHGFDGLDLDWENQTTINEMNHMATLLYEWKAAINRRAPHLLLTAALRFKPVAYTGVPFPVQAIIDNLDWVNVMAYDFYSPAWPPQPVVTMFHAPLYDPTRSTVSGSDGITAWINAGVPAKKLVFGLPFYGYQWKLQNANNHGIRAPAIVVENQDPNARTFNQIHHFIAGNGAITVYDPAYVANYCYAGTDWIDFDDQKTIAIKVAYAKNKALLLGYFSWCLHQDRNWALSTIASQTWDA
ncbi:acidic mammalian chitinase-like [Chenopodium quinoa]|uniref:acidic mammalian chitinase-like n=1 Tax=Chenopodium quinoa TaxID=63459 RepID=UPI000B77464D|nr:acidic mammalian chitinase-like [Chenopodium quinoa]